MLLACVGLHGVGLSGAYTDLQRAMINNDAKHGFALVGFVLFVLIVLLVLFDHASLLMCCCVVALCFAFEERH